MTLVWNICKEIIVRERESKERQKRRRDEGRVGGGGERAGKDEEGTLATTIVPDAQTNKLLVNRK